LRGERLAIGSGLSCNTDLPPYEKRGSAFFSGGFSPRAGEASPYDDERADSFSLLEGVFERQ
jgi:hypothetical protein